MAEVEIAPSFGGELKDGFKPVNVWVAGGISWLDDIQQFYRERSSIEKEYSQKLNALAKKYFEKKARKSSSLSVGETPTVTPGSLESASMTTWTVQLTTLESRAAEHERYANQIILSLAEPLKHLAAKYEDLRKSHADYASKLEKEKDSSYADLRKSKGKYDGVCQEVESKRKKNDNSFDHGRSKAQAAYQQQQLEMRNAKVSNHALHHNNERQENGTDVDQQNTYLIAINVTNKQKERYYHEYVPELLDSLQALSETRTAALNKLWSTASSLENQTMTRSAQLLEHQSSEISRNNPVLDSMMFVRHNAAQWQEPGDFAFEPSPVWLDDDTMATDPSSRTFLMNILSKSKSSLQELNPECEAKRREVEGGKRVLKMVRDGRDDRDEVEVVRAQFHNQESLHECERKRITAEVEVSTITTAVGDLTVGARTHTFSNQTYRIPTNCDLCGERLWGLSAKGLSCDECGFTCHTKCELKVPADCPGELNKEQKKAIKVERQAAAQAHVPEVTPVANGDSYGGGGPPSLQRSDTIGSMNTLSSGYAASAQRSVSGITSRSSEEVASSATTLSPAAGAGGGGGRHRMMAPPPTQYKTNDTDGSDEVQKGKMLYAYQATGEGEISITEGQDFTVLEADDGSGWIKIKPTTFGAASGLVPSSYTELTAPAVPAKPSIDDRPVSMAASASTTSLAGSDTPSIKKKQGPAVAPRRGAKKVKHVEAMYTYTANGPGEVNMQEGEKMVLLTPDQGDGWCEVEARAGKGVVPASWVRDA